MGRGGIIANDTFTLDCLHFMHYIPISPTTVSKNVFACKQREIPDFQIHLPANWGKSAAPVLYGHSLLRQVAWVANVSHAGRSMHLQLTASNS